MPWTRGLACSLLARTSMQLESLSALLEQAVHSRHRQARTFASRDCCGCEPPHLSQGSLHVSHNVCNKFVIRRLGVHHNSFLDSLYKLLAMMVGCGPSGGRRARNLPKVRGLRICKVSRPDRSAFMQFPDLEHVACSPSSVFRSPHVRWWLICTSRSCHHSG